MKAKKELMEIIQEAELEATYNQAAANTARLREDLLYIKKNYEDVELSYRKKCGGTAKQLMMQILEAERLSSIHSVRYRTKTVESLLLKYIKKKGMLPKVPGTDYEIEKYRPMTRDNYHKIITDLIGIRILIRYQKQWETVHEWIWEQFHAKNIPYIRNWLDEYPAGETNDFVAEKPKLYLRNMNDLPLYQKYGKDTFEVHNSREGYSSIHYVIWYDGKYVEVQVRTIYDEAWGECTHDLVYKCKDKAKKAELSGLSHCLASQTQAAGMIADLMFDKFNGYPAKKEKEDISNNDENDVRQEDMEKMSKLMQRMKKLDEKKFNGDVDSLC